MTGSATTSGSTKATERGATQAVAHHQPMRSSTRMCQLPAWRGARIVFALRLEADRSSAEPQR